MRIQWASLLLLTACGGYSPIGPPEQFDTTTCWEVEWACQLAEPSDYFDDLKVELVRNPDTDIRMLVSTADLSRDATVTAWIGGYARVDTIGPNHYRQPDDILAYRELWVFESDSDEHDASFRGPGMGVTWDTLPPVTGSFDGRCISPGWRYNCDSPSSN